MTQVKSAQENGKKLALRKRADPHTLAQRRAAFAAQMRDMALSDLAQVSARLKRLHKELEEREGREWTQQQLAEKMGIAYRTFQSWENGEVENRDGKGYDKMARFYSRKLERKVTRKWIVFGDDTPKPQTDDTDLLGQVSEKQENGQFAALRKEVAELGNQVAALEATLLAELGQLRSAQEDLLSRQPSAERSRGAGGK